MPYTIPDLTTLLPTALSLVEIAVPDGLGSYDSGKCTVADLGVAAVGADYAYYTPVSGATIVPIAGTRHVIVHPAAPIAALTLTLPPLPVDGQLCSFRTVEAITALTVVGASGETIVGTGFMLDTAGRADWIYRAADTTWYGGV